MQEIILTNNGDRNLKKIVVEFGNQADRIKIVSAFFSDTEFIIGWLKKTKLIDLLVSLRPPTNYYSLKTIQPKIGINIQFMGNNLHSKFYIFYQYNKPFAAIIGSSNFTNGGLYKNIETNAILLDPKYLTEIDKQFSFLWEQSFSLQPTDLDNYKALFDNFQKKSEEIEKEQSRLEKKILTRRAIREKKIKVGKEAKQYFTFWRIVDEVKELVKNISKEEYPNVPVYISIDHFWHWIKTVWSKEGRPRPTITNKNTLIPKLFKEYSDWDKASDNYTKKMAKASKNIFSRLLSENHIDQLTKGEAKTIYANLHSGAMRTRRFGADEKFVTENSIQQIKTSLKYLLYSNDELDLRIHNLCEQDSPYKLKQLKSSGAQELIGWVSPEKYPIRNAKADQALSLLGIGFG